MASIAKSGSVSIATAAPDAEHSLSGLYAGELLAAGDACYIKTSDGKIWRSNGGAGLAAPNAPTLTTATSGGTVLAGVYTAVISYINAQGETVASQSSDITTTGATSTITVASPAASGSGGAAATAYRVYMSSINGGPLTLQNGAGTAIATNLTLTAPPTTNGAGPLTSNTTLTGAAVVDGYAASSCPVGEPVTLYYGIRFRYGASLSPGTFVYLDTVAGGLSDAPTTGGANPIGRVIDATRIDLKRSY